MSFQAFDASGDTMIVVVMYWYCDTMILFLGYWTRYCFINENRAKDTREKEGEKDEKK